MQLPELTEGEYITLLSALNWYEASASEMDDYATGERAFRLETKIKRSTRVDYHAGVDELVQYVEIEPPDDQF